LFSISIFLFFSDCLSLRLLSSAEAFGSSVNLNEGLTGAIHQCLKDILLFVLFDEEKLLIPSFGIGESGILNVTFFLLFSSSCGTGVSINRKGGAIGEVEFLFDSILDAIIIYD
jgi:hypothetical protein